MNPDCEHISHVRGGGSLGYLPASPRRSTYWRRSGTAPTECGCDFTRPAAVEMVPRACAARCSGRRGGVQNLLRRGVLPDDPSPPTADGHGTAQYLQSASSSKRRGRCSTTMESRPGMCGGLVDPWRAATLREMGRRYTAAIRRWAALLEAPRRTASPVCAVRSHDAGGFHRHASPELTAVGAVRALSPLVSFHGTTSRLPWTFRLRRAGRRRRAAHALRLMPTPPPYSPRGVRRTGCSDDGGADGRPPTNPAELGGGSQERHCSVVVPWKRKPAGPRAECATAT